MVKWGIPHKACRYRGRLCVNWYYWMERKRVSSQLAPMAVLLLWKSPVTCVKAGWSSESEPRSDEVDSAGGGLSQPSALTLWQQIETAYQSLRTLKWIRGCTFLSQCCNVLVIKHGQQKPFLFGKWLLALKFDFDCCALHSILLGESISSFFFATPLTFSCLLPNIYVILDMLTHLFDKY